MTNVMDQRYRGTLVMEHIFMLTEYAVASTKAFSNMVAGLVLLALSISNVDKEAKQSIIKQLNFYLALLHPSS